MRSTASGKLVLDLQQGVLRFMEKARGVRAALLPDPLAAAWLVDPGIAGRLLSTGLRMELGQNAMRGASVTQRGSGVRLILDIDKVRFDQVLSRVIELKQ